MRELVVRRPHALGLPEARARVTAAAARIEERFGARCHWQGDQLAIEHGSLSGRVQVTPDEVTVRAHLGPALALFRGRAESEIRRILDRELTR